MSVLESILYGFLSGFAEFLATSSQGHQALLMRLFGMDAREPLRDLLVHAAVLASLMFSCRRLLSHLRREQLIASRSRRNHTYMRTGIFDIRLVKTAAFPMVVLLLPYYSTGAYEFRPTLLALFFLLNGLILIVPEYMRHGNKDSRAMAGVDGVLIGLFGGLSVLPGISRVGACMGIATARGAERKHGLNWALLLSIPALAVFIVFDVLNIFSLGTGALSFITFVGYILSAITAFIGGCAGISFVRFLTERTGFLGFAYYSWGLALFSFILYLIA